MENFSEITYLNKQTICENPRIIINPLLPELIAKYRCYVMHGYRTIINKSHIHYYNFDYRPFSIKKNGITKDDIDYCFVVDRDTGETFPIYVEVPCNQCEVCKQRKVNAFVQRCKFETQCYTSRPWFVTLTYDNEHVPENGSLCVRDVQLFMKRLRINLERSGYTFKIRYCIVGEYGSNTHRPHYHLILWGIDTYQSKDSVAVGRIIYNSWKNGYIQHRMIDPQDDKAFFYTTKYLKKDCVVPKNCIPPFVFPQIGMEELGQRSLLVNSFPISDAVLMYKLNSLIYGLEDQKTLYFLNMS